jgi:dynein heavy chain 1
VFESKFGRLKEERDNVAKAKEALELEYTGGSGGSEERVAVVFEEMQDLREVWSELSRIWQRIDETR